MKLRSGTGRQACPRRPASGSKNSQHSTGSLANSSKARSLTEISKRELIMSTNIAILAPGAMGSAVARRLNEHGARVLTSLAGRSEATAKRAAAAGMIAAGDADIADADIVLSIVPPAEAVALAQHL